MAVANDPKSREKQLLDALFNLARNCHAPQESATLFEKIMDCLLNICEAERGFILLPGKADKAANLVSKKKGLVVAVSRKLDGGDQFSRTVAKRVLASGQPLLVRDTSEESQLSHQESVIDAQIRSIMAAPIHLDGKLSGVIYLDTSSIMKVFTPEDLRLLEAAAEHVGVALENFKEKESLRTRADQLAQVVQQEIRREYDSRQIVGQSPGIRKVLEAVELLAPQETSALILGESGTGKELIARTLHELSPRSSGPFVAVNCMALAQGVLESELFGHEKGAFSGAVERRIGRFEMADGGTLFLDEIGELSLDIQVKLLRVLQEGEIERVGSGRSHPIRVRLVCATHADLKDRVARGTFREDFYYRIAVFPILLPPLRERREDIAPLVDHFAQVFGPRMGKTIHGIEPEALQMLMNYGWPGNIREFRNVMERAFVLERSPLLTRTSFPFPELTPAPRPAPVAGGKAVPLAQAREAFEREFILNCLDRHQGNIAKAARELDIPRSTIYRKLDAWGLLPAGESAAAKD
jgi:transcriptional regulator with GAF, ATPase, and Fis domain